MTDGPRLELAFELRLRFTRVQNIHSMPSGAGRGAVYVDSGEFEGPRLRGKAVPGSGGDYALFRPDGVLAFDARYMLQEDDGTLILLHNKGYLWGREPDTMQRLREMAFSGTPSQSDQLRNFSAIQAASPAGESVRPNASVCGLVP